MMLEPSPGKAGLVRLHQVLKQSLAAALVASLVLDPASANLRFLNAQSFPVPHSSSGALRCVFTEQAVNFPTGWYLHPIERIKRFFSDRRWLARGLQLAPAGVDFGFGRFFMGSSEEGSAGGSSKTGEQNGASRADPNQPLSKPELIEAVKELRDILPLELRDINPLLAPSRPQGWPSVTATSLNALSKEARFVMLIPDLMYSLHGTMDRHVAHAISLAYAAAYLRQLPAGASAALRNEARRRNYRAHLAFLTELSGLTPAKEIDSIVAFLKLNAAQAQNVRTQVTSYMKLRDTALSRARAFRIAAEAMAAQGGTADLPLLQTLVQGDASVQRVLTGLQPAGVLSQSLTEDQAVEIRKLFRNMRQVEGSALRLLHLPNGQWYFYDEYWLRYEARKNERSNYRYRLAVTQEGLEHLIRIEMTAQRGLLYNLAQPVQQQGILDEGQEAISRTLLAILAPESMEPFTRWDPERLFYRATDLCSHAFDMRPSRVRTASIATKDRPIVLPNSLESELEGIRIFNRQIRGITVIDDSEPVALQTNRETIEKLNQNPKYGVKITHLTGHDRIVDQAYFAFRLAQQWQAEIEAGPEMIDERIMKMLEAERVDGEGHKYTLLKNGRIDAGLLNQHLSKTTFFHISGVRCYTLLRAIGEMFMHFDDDAPPESYALPDDGLAKLQRQRSDRRAERMQEFMARVSDLTKTPVPDEKTLYTLLASPSRELRKLEHEYFGYSPKDRSVGLVPRAMNQIISRTKTLVTGIEGSNMRMEALMKTPAEALRTADMFRVSPRPKNPKKPPSGVWVFPVDMLGPAPLLGMSVEDSRLPARTDDLRATIARNLTAVEYQELQDKRIFFLAYIFAFDEDTKAEAQINAFRYMTTVELEQLQHTGLAALVAEEVTGFAGQSHAIMNRAIWDARVPMPTIGRALRLEEPVYPGWVVEPAMAWKVTKAIAPVPGGQIRSIGERLYRVSFQDLTEVVAGIAKYWYEKAIKAFEVLRKQKIFPDNNMDRLRGLGQAYIDVSRKMSLRPKEKDNVREQRQRRARMMGDLGIKLAGKSGKEYANISEVIVQYAHDFRMYHVVDISDRVKDYAPRNPKEDYFYRVVLKEGAAEGPILQWETVKPVVKKTEVTKDGLVNITEMEWEFTGTRKSIPIGDWRLDKPLNLVKGRSIVLDRLPKPGEPAIVPALVDDFEDEMLHAKEDKKNGVEKGVEPVIRDQLEADGETLLLWPDILDAAYDLKAVSETSGSPSWKSANEHQEALYLVKQGNWSEVAKLGPLAVPALRAQLQASAADWKKLRVGALQPLEVKGNTIHVNENHYNILKTLLAIGGPDAEEAIDEAAQKYSQPVSGNVSKISGVLAAGVALAGVIGLGVALGAHPGQAADWAGRIAAAVVMIAYTAFSSGLLFWQGSSIRKAQDTANAMRAHGIRGPDLATQTAQLNQLKSRLEAAHNITIIDESDLDLSRHAGVPFPTSYREGLSPGRKGDESRNPVAVNVLGPGFRRGDVKKDIAFVVPSEAAQRIIHVDLLAFSMLPETLQESILARHEMAHLSGWKDFTAYAIQAMTLPWDGLVAQLGYLPWESVLPIHLNAVQTSDGPPSAHLIFSESAHENGRTARGEEKTESLKVVRTVYPNGGVQPGKNQDAPAVLIDVPYARSRAGLDIRTWAQRSSEPFTEDELEIFRHADRLTPMDDFHLTREQIMSIRQTLYNRASGEIEVLAIIKDYQHRVYYLRFAGATSGSLTKLQAIKPLWAHLAVPGSILQVAMGNQGDLEGNFTLVPAGGEGWQFLGAVDEPLGRHSYKALLELKGDKRQLGEIRLKMSASKRVDQVLFTPLEGAEIVLDPSEVKFALVSYVLAWGKLSSVDLLEQSYNPRTDLRHVFRAPYINGRTVFLEQFSNSPSKLADAFHNKGVWLNLLDNRGGAIQVPALVHDLNRNAYVEKKHPEEVRRAGDYYVGKDSIYIVLLPAAYPVDLMAISQDGDRLAFVAVQGRTAELGANLWSVPGWARDKIRHEFGWDAFAIFALDHGMDPLITIFNSGSEPEYIVNQGRPTGNAALGVTLKERPVAIAGSNIAGTVAAAIAAGGALATGLAAQGHAADWRVGLSMAIVGVLYAALSSGLLFFQGSSIKKAQDQTNALRAHGIRGPDLATQTAQLNQLKSRLEAAHNITIIDESDLDLSRHAGVPFPTSYREGLSPGRKGDESRHPVAVNALGPGFRRGDVKKDIAFVVSSETGGRTVHVDLLALSLLPATLQNSILSRHETTHLHGWGELAAYGLQAVTLPWDALISGVMKLWNQLPVLQPIAQMLLSDGTRVAVPVALSKNTNDAAGSLDTEKGKRTYTYPAGHLEATVTNPNSNYARTSEGAVSVGMSMMMRPLYPEAKDYPNIIIAPQGDWVGTDGANLMQIYFSIAANFAFHKRKTKVVGTPEQLRRIQRYLELGNPYHLPNAAGYSADLMGRFEREAIYLADRAMIDGSPKMATPYPDMVELIPLDGDASVGNLRIHDRKDGTFLIEDQGKPVTVLNGNGMRELELELSGVTPLEKIPEFGVTFLGTSSGMDPNGLTSNQIVWAGSRHILIDIGASTRATMTAMGLNPGSITDIVITHLHEDHVAGALAYFRWHQEWHAAHGQKGAPIRLLAEPGIYQLFKEQAEQILNAPLESVYPVELVPTPYYEKLTVGKESPVEIETRPAWHGTPTTMLRLTYKGQTISHSSDTTYDPVRFKQILSNEMPANIRADMFRELGSQNGQARVFDQERADELTYWLFEPNQYGNRPQLVIHEVGNRAPLHENTSNHTTPYALHGLPQEYQPVIHANHAASLPPGEFNFPLAAPLSTVSLVVPPTVAHQAQPLTDGRRILWPTPVIIGHRAESIEQARRAISLGIRTLEMDVQLTKDNKLIALWGKVKTASGEKFVYEMTKAEIDAALGQPTLDVEDIFKFIQGKNIALMLDTKDWARGIPGYTARFIDRLAASLRAHGLEGNVLSAGFNEYPELLHKKIPGMLVGRGVPSTETLTPEVLGKYIGDLKASGSHYLSTYAGAYTVEMMDRIHSEGLYVATNWDPSRPDIMARADFIWADDDDYEAAAAYKTPAQMVATLKASKGYERLKGVTGFGPALTSEGEFFSLEGHLRRTAHLSRQLAEKYGKNADTAEFIALAHDYAALPFRHLATRGALASAVNNPSWNEKQEIVNKLKRDGFALNPRLETDLLNFDINQDLDISDEARTTLIAESIEGMIEDILFTIRVGRIKVSQIDPSLVRLLGIDTMPGFDMHVMNGFDKLVYKIADHVISQNDMPLEQLFTQIRDVKRGFREKFLAAVVQPAEKEAIERVSKVVAPVYQSVAKGRSAPDALRQWMEMTDRDVLTRAAQLGVIHEVEIQTYEDLLAMRNVLRPRRTIVVGAMESEFNKAAGQGEYMRDYTHALARRGHHVYAISPGFGGRVKGEKVKDLSVPIGSGFVALEVIRVVDSAEPNLVHYRFQDPRGIFFTSLKTSYSEEADKIRGAAEARLIAKAIDMISLDSSLMPRPDIIQVNDWQTALLPVYMSLRRDRGEATPRILGTVHNMAFQGIFNRELEVDPSDPVVVELQRVGAIPADLIQKDGKFWVDVHPIWDLPDDIIHRTQHGLEYYSRNEAGEELFPGKVNLMKGMDFVGAGSGVSEGNLTELTLPEDEGGFAFGLDGMAREMRDAGKLRAVYNGSDASPAADPYLKSDGYTTFSENEPDAEIVAKHHQNRRALIKEMRSRPAGQNFVVNENDFLLGSFGRINDQKGLDVLAKAIPALMKYRGPRGERYRIAIAGNPSAGPINHQIAFQLQELALQYPDAIYLEARFVEDDFASHFLAGIDAFLMPSLFEPGGIANQTANKYGAPVIASLTGGLIDFFDEWGGVGFSFPKFRASQKDKAAQDLVQTIQRASRVYWNHRTDWGNLVVRATRYDASWDSRIERYEEDIYEPLIQQSLPVAAVSWETSYTAGAVAYGFATAVSLLTGLAYASGLRAHLDWRIVIPAAVVTIVFAIFSGFLLRWQATSLQRVEVRASALRAQGITGADFDLWKSRLQQLKEDLEGKYGIRVFDESSLTMKSSMAQEIAFVEPASAWKKTIHIDLLAFYHLPPFLQEAIIRRHEMVHVAGRGEFAAYLTQAVTLPVDWMTNYVRAKRRARLIIKARNLAGKSYTILLAGGEGTRTWPANKLYDAFTASDRNLLQMAADRAVQDIGEGDFPTLVTADHFIVATSKEDKPLIEKALQALPGDRTRSTIRPENIIAEPSRRGTMAALLLSMAGIRASIPPNSRENPIITNLTGDHVIGKLPLFRETMAQAMLVAAAGPNIVTMGIGPSDKPSEWTGFGCIKSGAETDYSFGRLGRQQVYDLSSFHEKPSLEWAEAAMAEGGYTWNSGMFTGALGTFEQAMEEHCPVIAAIYHEIVKELRAGNIARAQELFNTIPKTTFDYAVMEPLTQNPKKNGVRAKVVWGFFPWMDIGSWDALDTILEAEQDGTRVIGKERVHIQHPGPGQATFVAWGANTIDIDAAHHPIVVVHHHQGNVLVVAKDHAQDVRGVPKSIKEQPTEKVIKIGSPNVEIHTDGPYVAAVGLGDTPLVIHREGKTLTVRHIPSPAIAPDTWWGRLYARCLKSAGDFKMALEQGEAQLLADLRDLEQHFGEDYKRLMESQFALGDLLALESAIESRIAPRMQTPLARRRSAEAA